MSVLNPINNWLADAVRNAGDEPPGGGLTDAELHVAAVHMAPHIEQSREETEQRILMCPLNVQKGAVRLACEHMMMEMANAAEGDDRHDAALAFSLTAARLFDDATRRGTAWWLAQPPERRSDPKASIAEYEKERAEKLAQLRREVAAFLQGMAHS